MESLKTGVFRYRKADCGDGVYFDRTNADLSRLSIYVVSLIARQVAVWKCLDDRKGVGSLGELPKLRKAADKPKGTR